ncbi:MAG: ParA family protein [Burkholderiaceae bacterium]|nr:ParA family protein [Burkholderiaceae bacterium]
MPVIAVINRKGGSGKSTLAAHVAAWLARQGQPVVLADADRQQSIHAWLRRRTQQAVARSGRLSGWSVDPRAMVRPPAGSQHMVIDTPGGLRGFDLARVVMYADAILMPVCNSAFDRESAAECLVELRALPRVASDRCRLAAIGMRIDARTRAEAVLRDWAQGLHLPFLGVLRDTQAYVRCIEDGLTMFDLPAAKAAQDLAQWQPILDWLAPMVGSATVVPAAPACSPAPALRAGRSARAQGGPPTLRVPQSVLRAVQGPSDAVRAPSAAAETPAGRDGAIELGEVESASRAARDDAVRVAPARPQAVTLAAHGGERVGDEADETADAKVAACRTPPLNSFAARPLLPRSGRIGRLLDALAVPRFLQRNS